MTAASPAPPLHDPARESWPLRLPGIRHVRWLFCSWRVAVWARTWAQHGVGLGVPNESDRRVLDAIWRGER